MTNSRGNWRAIIVVLLVHLSLLGIFAAFRNSVFDEGVYMNAARLVHDGQAIYEDFFFPQMMLLPTITSVVAQGGWLSFWVLRGLAVAAGLVSAGLVYALALKLTKNHIHSLIALAVYGLSGLIISWHSIFTAQVFAHLLSLVCFWLWYLHFEKRHYSTLLLLGIALSVLFNIRATFVVLVPIYAISIMLLSKKTVLKNIALFFGAMIPVSLPTMYKMLNSFDNFIFNTLTFQLLRESNNEIGYVVVNKLTTILRVLVDPHILLIVLMASVSVVMLVRRKQIRGARSLFVNGEGMAVMNLLLIAAVYMVPHPMMRQYTEQYLAFAVILGALSYPAVWDWLSGAGECVRKYVVTAGLALIFAGSLVPYFAVYMFDARESEKMYSLAEMKAVVEQIRRCGESNGAVLSEWAGYPFLAERSSLGRSEILGWEWPLSLGAAEFQKYRLPDYDYLRQCVIDKTPQTIVTVNRTPAEYADVVDDGYDMTYQSSGVTVFCRR